LSRALQPFVALLVVALPQAGTPATSAEKDARAAEAQYRIARRLAAEGSAEARAALSKVIELDPDGVLADDALVEQARLTSLPPWPEETGSLDLDAATQALGLLDQAVERFPHGDRLEESLYLRGLLRLEPLASYDTSAARVDLTAVATSSSPWSARARYALAWMQERQAHDDRAFDAYQRLLIDDPSDAAGARARVGVARVLLRRGSFGLAARRLQEAVDLGVGDDTRAGTLRELAVRSLLRDAGAADPSRPTRIRTGVRALAGFAPTANGGVLLGDRKQGLVVELDAKGARVGQWIVEGVQDVTVDPRGRRFAADRQTVVRLDDGGQVTPVASLGDYAPLGRLVADAAGGLWLMDRSGRGLGRLGPGQSEPQAFGDGQGPRLAAMIWDGRKLLAIDAKRREVVALGEGGVTPLVALDGTRPVALAADPAGRVAILDGKTGVVRFLHPNGRPEAAAFASPEIPRPLAVGLGPEGELQLFDANGDWIVFR
jgi:streptogramin lyase